MTKRYKFKVRYKYPPANELIVCNIARACLQHSKFYYQVCHLMNKMNLMPPFLPNSYGYQVTNGGCGSLEQMINESGRSRDDDDGGDKVDEDEDESEIESDGNYVVTGEDDDNYRSAVSRIIKRQRKRLKVGILGELKRRPAKVVDGWTSSTRDQDDEELESSLVKSIPIPLEPPSIKIDIHSYNLITSSNEYPESCLSSSSLQEINKEQSTNHKESQGFGLMTPKVTRSVPKEKVDQDETWINNLITDEEITSNRLTRHELINLPVYKDYSPGLTNCRLYLKNLSKKVTDHQLKCIYGRYINLNSESDRNMFHVQVFKTGRFRNQAFISLPNTEASMTALNETNGYLIEGKPLIVAFARSAKPTMKLNNSNESLNVR